MVEMEAGMESIRELMEAVYLNEAVSRDIYMYTHFLINEK